MKLKKQSWYYKAYDGTYPSNAPTNLCSFFWPTLFAVIMYPFLYIFCIPVKIFGMLDEDFDIPKKPFFGEGGVQIFISFLVWTVLFLIYCMIAMWWSTRNSPVFALGTFMWAIIICIGIYFLIRYLYNLWRESHPTGRIKEKKPNIVWEYIKAKKNKYCPSIEWE